MRKYVQCLSTRYLSLLNTYKSLLQVTTALSLIHSAVHYSTYEVLSVCCLQSLSGSGFNAWDLSNSVFTLHVLAGCHLSPMHQLNSTWSAEWYSLGADPTENTVSLLMWVARYHVCHCSSTKHLVSDRVATPFPEILLLRDVTQAATCSSAPCAIIVYCAVT
jgi:hypothetical protein